MPIVVGHDVNPGLLPYEAAYMMQQQALGQQAAQGQGALQAQAAATNARLRPQGGGSDLMARHNASQAEQGAGFDWQTPIQVFHDGGSQRQDGGSMFAPHASYDTLYQSQGVDPLASAAGVKGASAGFGKLGSREQVVYDPSNMIDPGDPNDRANLGKMVNALPYGSNQLSQDTSEDLFLSPDEKRQKAEDEKLNYYQRQQGVLQGGRERLAGQKAAQRSNEIKINAANKAAQIAQTYGLKGELQQNALAAALEREQLGLDQRQQQHEDNMTMAGSGSIEAAQRLVDELDHLSPEELALYGKDVGTRIAQIKGALQDYENHPAKGDAAGKAAVAKGLFEQLKRLEASKSQEKEMEFKQQKEKAMEERAAAAAVAKIAAVDTAQTNRLASQDHAEQLKADRDRSDQNWRQAVMEIAKQFPLLPAEDQKSKAKELFDMMQSKPEPHAELLQQDLPNDHPSLVMVENLAKSLKDAGVPLEQARQIIAARLGEQGAAA